MSYVDEVLELVKKKNASEPEFIQAVTEVLNSLRPVVEANEVFIKIPQTFVLFFYFTTFPGSA